MKSQVRKKRAGSRRKAGTRETAFPPVAPGPGPDLYAVLGPALRGALQSLPGEPASLGIAPLNQAFWLAEQAEVESLGAPPGASLPVASGYKSVHPTRVVYTLQEEDDLNELGFGMLVAAARRGELLTVIHTRLSPRGASLIGLLKNLEGVGWARRVQLRGQGDRRRLQKKLLEALTVQVEERGLSLVEIVPAPREGDPG